MAARAKTALSYIAFLNCAATFLLYTAQLINKLNKKVMQFLMFAKFRLLFIIISVIFVFSHKK